jgi:hypothetical protein
MSPVEGGRTFSAMAKIAVSTRSCDDANCAALDQLRDGGPSLSMLMTLAHSNWTKKRIE